MVKQNSKYCKSVKALKHLLVISNQVLQDNIAKESKHFKHLLVISNQVLQGSCRLQPAEVRNIKNIQNNGIYILTKNITEFSLFESTVKTIGISQEYSLLDPSASLTLPKFGLKLSVVNASAY